MRVKIKPTHQIQRINILRNQLAEIITMDNSLIMKRPHDKAWCCVEVIKHMVVSQLAYEVKIDKALLQSEQVSDEIDYLPTRAIPSFLIKRFPPVEGEIRLKMKTLKQFNPTLNVEKMTSQDVDVIVREMNNSLSQLENWVDQTRKKNDSIQSTH